MNAEITHALRPIFKTSEETYSLFQKGEKSKKAINLVYISSFSQKPFTFVVKPLNPSNRESYTKAHEILNDNLIATINKTSTGVFFGLEKSFFRDSFGIGLSDIDLSYDPVYLSIENSQGNIIFCGKVDIIENYDSESSYKYLLDIYNQYTKQVENQTLEHTNKETKTCTIL